MSHLLPILDQQELTLADSFPATNTADILLASDSQVTLTSATLTSDPCFMKTMEKGRVHSLAVLEGPALANPSSLIGSHRSQTKSLMKQQQGNT